jgi:hypothetical protein
MSGGLVSQPETSAMTTAPVWLAVTTELAERRWSRAIIMGTLAHITSEVTLTERSDDSLVSP